MGADARNVSRRGGSAEDLEQKVYVPGGTGHCPHGIEACGSGVDAGDIALPLVERMPYKPHQPAGSRMEPPVSVPSPPGQ